MREMGRRSEAAEHPFKGKRHEPLARSTPVAAAAEDIARPLILAEQVGNKQLIASACPAALALGLVPGMAVTQARALVHDLDVPAEGYHLVTGVREHEGRVWLGSLHEPAIAVLDR